MPYKDPARRAQRNAEYRKENREHLNSCARAARKRRPLEHRRAIERRQFATQYQSVKGRALHMLNNARARARRAGVPCAISGEWLAERLIAGVCEVTGLAFDFEAGHGRGHRKNPFAPSIDRIDQRGGYTPSNCRVVVWIYNRARGAFPDEAFDRMCRAYAAAKEFP